MVIILTRTKLIVITGFFLLATLAFSGALAALVNGHNRSRCDITALRVGFAADGSSHTAQMGSADP